MEHGDWDVRARGVCVVIESSRSLRGYGFGFASERLTRFGKGKVMHYGTSGLKMDAIRGLVRVLNGAFGSSRLAVLLWMDDHVPIPRGERPGSNYREQRQAEEYS